MISKAVGRYLRVSPRKVRLVIPLIKGRPTDEALSILRAVNKKSAYLVAKVVNSAIANANALPGVRKEDLYISRIFADGGPALKRFKAQAMGRAAMIKRRTSHITVELDAKEPRLALKTPKKPLRHEKEKAPSKKVDSKKQDRAKPRVENEIKKSVRKGVKSGT